jgi:transposase
MTRAARCRRRGPVFGAANVLDVDAIEQHAQLRGIERDAGGTLSRGTRTVAQVADDLGVATNILHRWAQKFDKDAVTKRNGEGETLEQEVRRLRKENEQLRMDKAILKKAAAFFAKDSE